MCFLHTKKKYITQNKTLPLQHFYFIFYVSPIFFFFEKEYAFMRGIKTYKKGG